MVTSCISTDGCLSHSAGDSTVVPSVTIVDEHGVTQGTPCCDLREPLTDPELLDSLYL